MKKALIVSKNRYPEGDAGAVRSEAFAQIFQQIGYDCLVIGLGEYSKFEIKKANNISYMSLRGKRKDFFSKVRNYICFNKRLKKHVLTSKSQYDLICLVGGNRHDFSTIKKYAKLKNSILLHDCVEWYSPEEFKLGKLSRAYIMNNVANTKWIDKCFNVISISQYLQEHFTSRKINSLRVPVILDVHKIPCMKNKTTNKIVITYAGAPGKKDYFTEILLAIGQLSKEEKENLELRIVGVTKEKLFDIVNLEKDAWEKIKANVNCVGRVSRKEVYKHLAESDFTILIRADHLRYAKAGFPTKIPESLSTGTPVICNYTSDLQLYLTDKKDSIIVKECSVSAVKEAIQSALSLKSEQIEQMKKNARETAEKYFDYAIYIEKITKFLESANKIKN